MTFDEIADINAIVDWNKLLFITVSTEMKINYDVRCITQAYSLINYNIRKLISNVELFRYQLIAAVTSGMIVNYSALEIINNRLSVLYDTSRPDGLKGYFGSIQNQIGTTAVPLAGKIIGASVMNIGGIIGSVEEY